MAVHPFMGGEEEMSTYWKTRVQEAVFVLCLVAILVPVAIFAPSALEYIFVGVITLGVLTLWLTPRGDEEKK